MSNIKFALSAIAFTLASGAALAQEAVAAQWNSAYTPDVSVHQTGKSRADVVAELLAAQKAGELSRYDHDSYSPVQLSQPLVRTAAKPAAPVTASAAVPAAKAAGAVTREQVREELLAARRSGELNVFDADPYVNVPTVVAAVPAHTSVAAR